MKKRGPPRRPSLNVRLSPEEILAEREQYPEEDPFSELLADGQGIDYRLPIPPWDDYHRTEMADNLARLRVDPCHSNHAQLETPLVRAIAGLDFEYYDVGLYIGQLLAEWSEDTAKQVFGDILRMKRTAEHLPHRNFLAYLAYCDFLKENGFEPTRQRLARYIKDNPAKYPVGINKPTTDEQWWEMFRQAGLVRLEE
tara:strand:- start:325 stop:915 length:591 start_codon:yes stop_codon:yes gene_type:complete